MKLKTVEVGTDWHRVLHAEFRNKEHQEFFEKQAILIEGVQFLTKNAISQINTMAKDYYSTHNVVVPANDDYSEQVFLFKKEFNYLFIQAVTQHLKAYPNVISYIDTGILGNSQEFVVATSKAGSWTGNPRTSSSLQTVKHCSYSLNDYDATIFNTQEEKQHFLDTEIAQFIQTIQARLEQG